MRFVAQHRERFGAEPICRALQVAPSAYWREATTRQRDPARRTSRQRRDAELLSQIERIWRSNLCVYGADKVWKPLHREGVPVARCTVERLMRQQGWQGARRGKKVRTTVPAKAACPLDRVNRQFKAERPNQLWVSDFTYVPTWQGFIYVAFVIDVYARYIVGWRVSRSMQTDFVLDALEQIDHLVESAAEEVGRVTHREKLPENRAWRDENWEKSYPEKSTKELKIKDLRIFPGRLLLRPVQPLAARLQREHQRTGAPVPAQGHGSVGLQPGAA